MKIHGHSTIELTNIHTGEVERYENDNMVTNALDYYFQDVGAFNTSPIYDADVRNNLIPRLLGGLLLFDTELTESADNIICPSGVKMVGNGAYGHSSGSESEVTEMGTYDNVESHWTSDGKCVMVWSFATSQANCDTDHNQQIKCACLTSAKHGYIGEGNANSGKQFPRSSDYREDDYSLKGTPQSINIDNGNYQASRILRASRTSNTITMIDEHSLIRTIGYENEHMSETGKLKFVTYKMPIKKLDMRFGAGFQYIPTTEVEVSVQNAFVTALNHGDAQLKGKVGDTYFLAVGFSSTGGSTIRWNANSNIHVLRINADNTTSYYAVANPSDGNIDFLPTNFILAGDVLMVTDSTGTWFVDVTNPSDITHEDIGVSMYDFVYPDLGVAYGDSVKVDIGERKVYYANLMRNTGNSTLSYQFLSDNPLTNSYNGNGQLYKTTNYLATINNLDTPVVKTQDKTMKVTYVLSFED